MDELVYVCKGTCSAQISKEQYEAGLTQCGTDGCDQKGHVFTKMYKCSQCQQLYQEGETHSH